MENVRVKLWFKSSWLMHYLNNKGKFIRTSYQTFLTNLSSDLFCPLFSRSNNFFQLKRLTFCPSAVKESHWTSNVEFDYFLKQTTYQTQEWWTNRKMVWYETNVKVKYLLLFYDVSKIVERNVCHRLYYLEQDRQE